MAPENIIKQIIVYLENQIEAENQIYILRTIEHPFGTDKKYFLILIFLFKNGQ